MRALPALLLIAFLTPAPDQPPPPLPIGTWSGGQADESYVVVISEQRGRIIGSWLVPEDGSTAYFGVWTRQPDGSYVEKYCPPGRYCNEWHWEWDGKEWLGTAGWRLWKPGGPKVDF